MTYGAAIHGSNRFVIQYTPHVALYTIVIGVIIYPLRYFWVPLLLFLLVLMLPVILPNAQSSEWDALLADHFHCLVVVMAVNALGGMIIGVVAVLIHKTAQRHLTPYAGDLVLAFSAQAVFFAITVLMLFGFDWFQFSRPPEAQALLGYDSDYLWLGFMRLLRGCTVMLVFVLVFLQRPKPNEWAFIWPVTLCFVALSLFHSNGVVGYKDLDAAVLALALSLSIPAAIAPIALSIGVSVHSALTGAFLMDNIYPSSPETMLNLYSVLILGFVGFVLTYRSSVDHRAQTSAASLARLDAARDFAGVGVFIVNQTTGIIQLDPTARRVMGVHKDAMLVYDLFEAFPEASRKELDRMGIVEPGQAENLLLDVDRAGDTPRTIRVLVWAERAESGAKIAYGLVLDVTDEHHKQEALETALRVLEDKDEKQRRMFSIISHEIRTPASVIAMLVEDLEPDNTALRKNQLEEATNQLLGVLSDMRQAVNPEQNLALTKEPYVPLQLAETLRNVFHLQAQKHDMQIVLSMDADAGLRRVGDRTRVKQLVGNLIRNSLIHSKGTKVEVAYSCFRDEDGRTVSRWIVRDDGVGVPPDQVDKMFEPFERGASDPRNQADGSGLGLYIAKMTVDLLGGTIAYVGDASGAAYRVQFPEDIDQEPEPAAPVAPVSQMALTDMNVLLAEDNALVAEVTRARLAKVFGSVRTAENGRVAVEAILDNAPDVLISDLFMPEMEGDELIHRLREDGYGFPMIGLTAAVVGDDMDRFHAAGADAVFAKPIKMDELTDFLASMKA